MAESKLALDNGLVDACRATARGVARQVSQEVARQTTLSVERTVVRLFGVDGVDRDDVPLPNLVVDHVNERNELGAGIAFWLGNAALETGLDFQAIAEDVATGALDLCALPRHDAAAVARLATDRAQQTLTSIREARRERADLRASLDEGSEPRHYVLTATGNVYEDVRHARAVAHHGGDIVAVIRSTAQSLLDYVPYGPTVTGHGGTFATQENFRIMRAALDEWSREHGRYVCLSSFCSGLCMPEIAAMGALEGLDNMVNDALYGILYRDIHMRRTLIDQAVSRRINGYVGIVINTGEDNYLRTADAIDAAPSVVASQFINYYLARECGVPDAQIALGNAFEVQPDVTNGLLYEWAHAQLTRELFPDCPVKYMPPTKHMNGNSFRTHACDTLFNLVTVATGQAIQTIGVPTEGVFTPHIHDRVLGLDSATYVANFARDLSDEIEFKPGGFVQQRAGAVLRAAAVLLEEIEHTGLFGALERGVFGDVLRSANEGRGAEGILACAHEYFNPFMELMSEPVVHA